LQDSEIENDLFPSANQNKPFLSPYSSQSGGNRTNNHALDTTKKEKNPKNQKNDNDTFLQKTKQRTTFHFGRRIENNRKQERDWTMK